MMKTVACTGPMILVMALTAGARPAQAQTAAAGAAAGAPAAPAVRVTPFVSIDSRGSTPIGTAVLFPLSPRFAVETEVGYRRAEGNLKAMSTTASLLYMLPRVGRTTPYLAGGAGIAQYGSPLVSREGSVIGTQPLVALQVNAGGGFMIPVDTSWGIRTDARWFKSFGRTGSEHWRLSNGISFDVKK